MSSGIASALFGAVQQQVLRLIYGRPDHEYQSAELIAAAKSGTGAVHRELLRLERSGLVTARRRGNHKYYQANRESPVYEELHGLVMKTVGLAEPLRAALLPLAERILAAAIYGSVAKGTDSSESDVDLLVISDDLSHAELFEALQDVEHLIGRQVNPTLVTATTWSSKLRERDSFASRVAHGELLPLLGAPDVLRPS